MLVYGDPARTVDAGELAEQIRERLARGDPSTSILIDAAELLQGLADRELAERGCDARSPAQDALMRFLVEMARGGAPGLELQPRGEIRARTAEGFAFYALYPEQYLEAARALAGRRLKVVGLRSIGTALAPMVAAGAGAPRPVTVRPGGHPFRRELALDPQLAAELSDPQADYAIVDEGPGLSGSSFGAAADFLEERGVAPSRIHFFPGHLGELGPQAHPRHRERWARAQKHLVGFEELILPKVAQEASALLGAPLDPLEDLSGGAWRRGRRIPSNVQQERRKYRAGAWRLRFAGLGRHGEAALERARRLQGFVPEVAGLVNGFLVERGYDAATPARVPLEHLARYLAARTRLEAEEGASIPQLRDMARHNAGGALDDWHPDVGRLERRVRRVATDNRLHAWEWLQLADGRLLKADAVDHCAGHDLVGCQDLAWDVAGASLELGHDPEALRVAVERESRREVDRELVDFCLRAYPAFQLGHCALSAQALAFMPEEAALLQQAAEGYRARLTRPPASRTPRRP